MRRHADIGFILLAALLVTMPLILQGNSCGHDQSFHLISWMEAATQWTHGTLRPFWAFHPAWLAGEPRFVFYPPLSWALGALLGMVLPWSVTLTAYTLIATSLCGLAMRSLLRRFVSPLLAAAGACLYVANPYMLFVIYERAAYAELLGAAWLPLLLLVALDRKIHPRRLAVVVALLWLTNAPAAIAGSYTLLLLGLFRLARGARSQAVAVCAKEALQLLGGYLLGLALAGFFLVPALAQRRFAQLAMAIVPGMRPSDSFLFEHTGQSFHDAVLRSASWIAVAVFAVALASAATLLLRQRYHQAFRSMKAREAEQHAPSHKFAAVALVLLTVVLLFLLTPASATLWTHAPQLAFLQFPWRFLTVETGVAALLLTMLLASVSFRPRYALGLALCFAALMPWIGNRAYRQSCDEEDALPARIEAFQANKGIDPTDEYTPATADNDALQQDLPAAWLTVDGDGGPSAATLADVVTTSDGNPSHLRFDIRAASERRTLVIRLRDFPGWALQEDGTRQALNTSRDDGLVTVDLPGNTPHTIELRYRWTADEYAGTALSVVALAVLLLFRRNAWRPSRRIERKAA